jgi:hypothetical protein
MEASTLSKNEVLLCMLRSLVIPAVLAKGFLLEDTFFALFANGFKAVHRMKSVSQGA